MTDGINTTGFTDPKINPSSPWATESYTEAPTAAFSASDMSSQGNAGLNQEGAIGAMESASDYSEGL
jgi:hypothetical protein